MYKLNYNLNSKPMNNYNSQIAEFIKEHLKLESVLFYSDADYKNRSWIKSSEEELSLETLDKIVIVESSTKPKRSSELYKSKAITKLCSRTFYILGKENRDYIDTFTKNVVPLKELLVVFKNKSKIRLISCPYKYYSFDSVKSKLTIDGSPLSVVGFNPVSVYKLEDSLEIIYLDDYQYEVFEKENCIITGSELVIGKKCMLVIRNNSYYSSVKACINCADGLYKYQLEEVV